MVQVMSSPSADLRATPRRRAVDDQATFLSRWLKVWVILLTVVVLVVVGYLIVITNSLASINGTARGINSTAGTILNTARNINDGVAQININLDDTLRLAQAIKADTNDILVNARPADRNLDCVENGALTGMGSVPGPVPC